MKKPLIVRCEAEADLSAAYQWYEQQVRGLGAEFLLCVDAVMASIERNPQLYPVVHRGVIRRSLTRRFPYGVFLFLV
jgi:toxin ParE1/3/4